MLVCAVWNCLWVYGLYFTPIPPTNLMRKTQKVMASRMPGKL